MLAEKNGCQSTLPDWRLVPTRTVKRPISLVTSLTLTIPEMLLPGAGGGKPTEVKASKFDFDQVKPPDGSMNHSFGRPKL